MTSARLRGEERVALTGLVAMFIVTAAWWALAIWPVADAPEWLARTRYACFGVRDSGLPDAGGWIGLIAGPLGMLTILLAAWGRAVRSLIHKMRISWPVTAIMSALLIGSLVLLGGAGWRIRQAQASTLLPADAGAPASTYPRLNRTAPALELTAHDGSRRSLVALRGRTVLLTFAYAHCTTVCPLVVHDVLRAQRLLRARGHDATVLVVTLDPWRDTPARLAAMATDWKFPASNAWLLGGTVAEVERALTAWDVPRSRNDQTGEVTHPSLVYIIDSQGQIAFAATGGAETIAALAGRL